MTDRKMTKAEMAAQIGTTPAALARQERARQSEIDARFAAEVEARLTPTRTPPELLSGENIKGALAGLKAIPGLALQAIFTASGLQEAADRSATPDSDPNRIAAARLVREERPAPPAAPGGIK